MPKVEPFYDIQDPTNLIAAVLMFANGIFGIICNSLIVYIFYKEKLERTSFNLICLFRALVNNYILMITFSVIFLPVTILGFSPYSPIFETWDIAITNTLYLVNEYQTILIAFNRFVALFFPVYYSKLCGFKITLIILLAMYLFRVTRVIFQVADYIPLECYVTYQSAYLTWMPTFRKECSLGGDGLLIFMLITFISIAFFNILVLIRIVRFYKNSDKQNVSARKKIKKNIILFFQTLLQDSLYLIDITFTYQLSGLSENRFWSFLCGTFVWQMLHSFDGFIMIMFNERLTLLKKKLWTPKTSQVRSRTVTVSAMPSVER